MSDFDIDAYLAKKFGPAKPGKVDEVLRARESKIQELRDYNAAIAADTPHYQALEKARENSWVNRLGLRADEGIGRFVDGAAAIYSGTSRMAGEIGALSTGDATATAMDSSLSEEEIQAINRFKNGSASPEDLALINQRPTLQRPVLGGGEKDLRQLGSAIDQMTPLERFEAAAKSREQAANVRQAFDRSGAIHPDSRNALRAQLQDGAAPLLDQVGKGWGAVKEGDLGGLVDMASGGAQLAVKAGQAAVDNPWGSFTHILENAPQLGVGAMGTVGKVMLAGSNAGYASRHYQEGITNFQEANKGAYPDEAQRTEMAAWAAASGLAEQAGDLSILKGFKGAAGANAAAEVADATRRSLVDRAKAVLLETGKGAATESATEGFQTHAEGEAQLKPASAMDIYEGAAIGGISGAGLQGGGRAVQELLTPNPGKSSGSGGLPSKELSAAVTKAQEDGDVSALLDPKSATYAPAYAIAALERFSAKGGDQVRSDALTKAGEVVAELEARRDAIAETIKTLSPEGRAASQATLAVLEAKGDTETAAMVREELAAQDKDKKGLDRAVKELARVDALLGQSREVLARFSERSTAETASAVDPKLDVAAEVKTISASTDAAANQATADRIIVLSMVAPSKVTDEHVTALVDNIDNGLSDVQRTYLRNFSEARAASNALKDTKQVNEEVLFGGNGNVGLAQYRRAVGAAVTTGNKALVTRYLGQLTSFAESHRSKAALMQEALKENRATGLPVQVIRNESGAWEINRGALLSQKEATKTGSPTIHRGTPESLIAAVQAEASAIDATLNELTSLVALKFPAASVAAQQGGPDVQNVPQSRQDPSALLDGTGGSPAQATEGRGLVGPVGAGGLVEGVPGADGLSELRVPGSEGASVAEIQASPDAADAVSTEPVVDPVTDSVSSTVAVDGVEGQNQSTENSSINPDGVTQDAAQVTDAEASAESVERTSENAEPTLSSLAERSESGTSFNLRNLIADHFTQASGDSAQPLGRVKNFLSGLKQQGVGDSAVLQHFLRTAESWFGKIQANLPILRKQEQRLYDAMQFLLNRQENGTAELDENVKTAIALAAYNWIAAEATSPAKLLNSQINAILGKDKSAWVSKEISDALRTAGVYQHAIADSLGGAVMKALGLRPKADAPLELEPKLRMALGLHALKLLEDLDLVKRTVIDGNTMARFRGESPESDLGRVKHEFIAVARDRHGKPTIRAESILSAVRGSGGVLDKLFGAARDKVLPSFSPITQVQKYASGTRQKIPTALRKVILKNQTSPRVVLRDKLDLFAQFTDDQIDKLIGVEPVAATTAHKVFRSGREAKNEALRREYDNFMEWVGEHLATAPQGLATPFYLPFNVWKQQRVGIASNVVNPQTSKSVRFLIGSPEWKTKIDPSNQALMDSFWLRVAEGLGVKVERQDNALSIAKVQAMVAEPKYAAAVDALRQALVDGAELSKTQTDAIVEAVGGDRLHALDVLIGVARQQAAMVDEVQQPFEVQMMGEVDGVANGTMLNHVLLGAGSQAMLNQGGFFELGNTHTQYNQWRGTAGNLDIYETTARKVFQAVGRTFPPGSPDAPVVASIWAIAKEIFNEETQQVTKEGRNLIKDAMNPLAFGSGMEKSVEGMADAFLAKVYEKFEELAEGGAEQSTIDQWVKHINTLIGDGMLAIPTGQPISWHLENVLSPRTEQAIRNSFSQTVGAAVSEVVGTEFAPFLSRRNQLNAMAQVSYALYDAVYQGVRANYIAELVAKGELFADDKGPLTDLSKLQEAELTKRIGEVLPIVETSMSQRDAENSGLFMAKSDRAQNPSRPYQNDTKFGTPVKSTGAKSASVGGITVVRDGPGVAMGSAQTHSLDSAISHDTQAQMDVLNIHDAVGAGVGQLGQAARLMNQNTWLNTLNYSPLGAQHQALARMVESIAALIAQGTLPPQALRNLASAVPYLAKRHKQAGIFKMGAPTLQALLIGTKEAAAAADTDKLRLMKNWTSVDQYAFQGGNYEVTEADRAKAKEMLNGLTSKPEEVTLAAAAAIQTAMAQAAKGSAKAAPAAAAQPTAPESRVEPSTSTEKEEEPQHSPFGTLGKAVIAADPQILAFFKANPRAKASEVLGLLSEVLADKRSPSAMLMRSMLPLLKRTLPDDLVVQLVTAKTGADAAVLPTKPSVGWFVSGTDGRSTAYILSPDFKESALQPEVLLHELIHGALSRVIDNPTGESKELVRELEELMAEAKRHAERQGLTGFAEALSSVQEFVAYGLSNQAFQRQVLSQISLPSRTDQTTLVTGMKAFIDKVVALVFRGSSKSQQEQAVNGLAVLVQNVSGLFAAANGAKDTGSINLSMAAATTRDYSTLDIHTALHDGAISPAFSQHIANILTQVIQVLHGPFGVFKAAAMQQQAQGPVDVWAKALNSGLAPFASSVLQSPLRISPQEAHAMEQVEATLREVLDSPEASSRSVYRELSRLYKEMSEVLQPSDFNSQAEYDYVFKVERDDRGHSHHLARFAAFGLANEQVNKLLQRPTRVVPAQGHGRQTFAKRLQALFERALEYLQERMTHVYAGQRADEKLKSLVYQLVDIEGKQVSALAQKSWLSGLAPLEAKAKQLTDGAVKAVVKAASSPKVVNSSNTFVKTAGAMTRIYANNQVNAFVEAFTHFRNQGWNERLGLIAGTLNYAMQGNKVFEALLRERKRIEGQRKDIITNRTKMAREMFVNGGQDIDHESSEAITRVFLRTGLHVLTDRMSMPDIERLLGDRRALLTEIRSLERSLSVYGASIQEHFINKANALGYFRATGEVRDPILMMNAHNIARLYGTAFVGRLSPEQIASAQAVLEQLVALNALDYANGSVIGKARQALAAENQRTDGGNGVAAILALHKHMEQESRSRLFESQEALMQHGYTPEIMNPHVDVQVATQSEGAYLVAAGYEQVGLVGRDPADPVNEQRFIYAMRDGGLNPMLTGAISYSGKGSKGSKKHSGYLNPNTANGLANASMNADVLSAKPAGLSTGAKQDLRQVRQVFMAPILNPNGEIVNWRYLMADKTRDDKKVLERDNRFDRVLGVMAGSIFDKQTTTETNVKTIEALKEHYDLEGAKHPQSYVLVGPASPDAEGRNIWDMLPDETKAEATRIWGADGMYVQRTLQDIVFGYRKLSLADAVRNIQDRRALNKARASIGLSPLKAKGYQEEIEEGAAKLFTGLIEHALVLHARAKHLPNPQAYAMSAAAKVASAERMWQELVQETKDLIVVKSITVLIGNVRSNMSLLLMSGVPIKDLLRDHLVALRGATSYQHDSEELDRIQTLLDAGLAGNNEAKLRREVELLKDSLARNPVRELIDAGLMPSIVEDTSEDDDIYSYKSKLSRTAQELASNVHPMVRTAANEIYMGRDTKMYQGLRRFTQLSDFMARYTQYQYLTTREENPLSKADAMQQASDDFVNYDIPMQRTMQYLDDMGIFMFTKYFLRIQKVILRLTKEKPGRVLSAVALDQFMSLGPIVLDSSWVGRVGNNPLSWGALQYPGSLDELATVSAGMALVK